MLRLLFPSPTGDFLWLSPASSCPTPCPLWRLPPLSWRPCPKRSATCQALLPRKLLQTPAHPATLARLRQRKWTRRQTKRLVTLAHLAKWNISPATPARLRSNSITVTGRHSTAKIATHYEVVAFAWARLLSTAQSPLRLHPSNHSRRHAGQSA